MSNLESILDKEVQLAPITDGPEPTLRNLIRRYYGEHFGVEERDFYTAEYIKGLLNE